MSDSVTLWTVACQAPLSMAFSRQEYWSGLPCSPPGDLLDPGIEPGSLKSPALAGGFFLTSTTWEALYVFGSSFKSILIWRVSWQNLLCYNWNWKSSFVFWTCPYSFFLGSSVIFGKWCFLVACIDTFPALKNPY